MAQTYKVEIQNMRFNPGSITVATGDTVEWTNRMGMVHTVTGDNGEFDSSSLARDATFSQTFTAAGSVTYHCEIHRNMKGTVIVT